MDVSADKYFQHLRTVSFDGQHRRHVLLLPEVCSVESSVVPVPVDTRKDGAPMPYVDCLWLGCELNHAAELVRVITPLDHVHINLSYLKTIIRTSYGNGALQIAREREEA